jgi:hypothetical protein
MVSEPTELPEVVSLQAEAADIQTQVNELDAVYTNLSADHVDWPTVASAIRNYDVNRMAINTLQQSENRLTLSGSAVDDSAVINYARLLEDSGYFSRVVVQSITLTTPSPTPTLSATATAIVTPTVAPTATSEGSGDGSGDGSSQPDITPTSDGRDAYEVDNTVAPPIFLGEIQSRNFYPNFDVDTAVFLAKAGRYYKVETASLAPGVDTFLTVTIGETVLTNDDAKPGTLSSEIAFQMAADRDAEVMIQITNRGQYGIAMSYQLFVQEIVPTVEPTVVPTSTPVPTATPTSAVPTPTPTATADLRDQYEPDNSVDNAKLIAVGQIQTHNLFPQSDVDKVNFLVKQGHHYQVATSSLALGVDTSMQLQYGVETWENDDYAKPGSGNFASAICFPATADGQAIVTVSQSGAYAPDKTYNLSLSEVPELKTDKEQIDFGRITGGTNPPTQNINLTGTGAVNWTAETEASWLSLNAASGTTPATLAVTANINGLPVGSYEDSVTLSWATVCQHHITVTLEVASPVGLNIPLEPAEPAVVLTGLDMSYTAVLPRRESLTAKRNTYQSGPVEFVIILELQGGPQ